MKEQQEIIQKICGKLKHQEVEKGTDWCVCKEIVACYKVFGELGILITYELLGWLKSKEVLIGVFKKEQDLQYHQSAMGYTVEECLEYYGEYLK